MRHYSTPHKGGAKMKPPVLPMLAEVGATSDSVISACLLCSNNGVTVASAGDKEVLKALQQREVLVSISEWLHSSTVLPDDLKFEGMEVSTPKFFEEGIVIEGLGKFVVVTQGLSWIWATCYRRRCSLLIYRLPFGCLVATSTKHLQVAVAAVEKLAVSCH
jgi:hypothetical protein